MLGGRGGKPGTKEAVFPHDFYLGVHEVTQGQWEAVMGKGRNPSRFRRGGEKEAEVEGVSDEELRRFPVDGVSWETCQEFVKRLNALTREDGWEYRLPTSQEWEYACRCGSPKPGMDYHADFFVSTSTNKLSPRQANFKEAGLGRPCPVGSYRPNWLGLYDMHGNVFEVCEDEVIDDGEPLRWLKGGGYLDDADSCRAANTNRGSPSAAYDGSGLRIARVPAP
jgi:formylglycine-generating enzyme required for sulfatase activity